MTKIEQIIDKYSRSPEEDNFLRKFANDILGALNEEMGEMTPWFLPAEEMSGTWQEGWEAAKIRASELLFDNRLHDKQ